MSRATEEILYPALEDFRLDIVVGQGPAARTLTLDLPQFTLIGATTRTGLLTTPLRDRFGLTFRLDLYDAVELAAIVRRSARIFGVEIDDDAAELVAARSRGTPRIANRILRRVRDVAEVRHEGAVTTLVAEEALRSSRSTVPGSSASTASCSARSSRNSAAGRSGFRRSRSRSARRRRRSRTSTSRSCSSSASCSARRAGGWSPTSGARTSAHCPTTGRCSDEHRDAPRRRGGRSGRRGRPVRSPPGQRRAVRAFRRQRARRRLGRDRRGGDRRVRRALVEPLDTLAGARRPCRQGARVRAVLRERRGVRAGDERRGRRVRLRGGARGCLRRGAARRGDDGRRRGRRCHAGEAACRRARGARGGSRGARGRHRRRRGGDAHARTRGGRDALVRARRRVPRRGRAARARRPRVEPARAGRSRSPQR